MTIVGQPISAMSDMHYAQLKGPPTDKDTINCRCCTGDYRCLTSIVGNCFCNLVDACRCKEDCCFIPLFFVMIIIWSPIWILAIVWELLMLLVWLITFGYCGKRCWGFKYQIRRVRFTSPHDDGYRYGTPLEDWRFAEGCWRNCLCDCHSASEESFISSSTPPGIVVKGSYVSDD